MFTSVIFCLLFYDMKYTPVWKILVQNFDLVHIWRERSEKLQARVQRWCHQQGETSEKT